jgi:hypothetical protein
MSVIHDYMEVLLVTSRMSDYMQVLQVEVEVEASEEQQSLMYAYDISVMYEHDISGMYQYTHTRHFVELLMPPPPALCQVLEVHDQKKWRCMMHLQ